MQQWNILRFSYFNEFSPRTRSLSTTMWVIDKSIQPAESVLLTFHVPKELGEEWESIDCRININSVEKLNTCEMISRLKSSPRSLVDCVLVYTESPCAVTLSRLPGSNVTFIHSTTSMPSRQSETSETFFKLNQIDFMTNRLEIIAGRGQEGALNGIGNVFLWLLFGWKQMNDRRMLAMAYDFKL